MSEFDSRQVIIVPTYLPLLDRVVIDKEIPSEAEAIARKILRNFKRYYFAEQLTGVPAAFIGALHHLECGGDFSQHLANGDPISQPTVNEPVGIPAGKWEDCAIAALELKGWTLDAQLDWNDKLLWLWRAEKWNGWGYRTIAPETPSPYLWSGTSESRPGKYVSDGKWDADAISKQVGCVAIWLALGIKLRNKTVNEPALNLETIATTDPVIGVLKINTKTWIKSSTQMAKSLAISDKYPAHPDQIIPIYQRLPDKADHYNVLVKAAGVLRSVFCYSLHAGIEMRDEVNPDEVGAVEPDDKPEIDKPTVESKDNPTYQVRFRMQLRKTSNLLYGILEFILDGKTYNEIICTSSLPNRQYDSAWNRKGGLIPPTSVVKSTTGKGLKVKTTPVFLPNVIGVSGNFYPIEPFEMETDGNTRGDFGMHADANVPGSMGCIVPKTERGWAAMQREFRAMAALGIRSIDLIVEYS